MNRTRTQTIRLYHSFYQLRVKGLGELLFLSILNQSSAVLPLNS